MKERLGIFGGTFNPIHFGHLIVAREALEEMKLDHVIFVPANIPPHKNKSEIIDSRHRLKMIQLAIDTNKIFSVSAIELERSGKSYTVETLKSLKGLYEKSELFFMIGADNLKDIKFWKDPEGILKEANLIILARPGYMEYFKNPEKYFPFLTKDEFVKKVTVLSVTEIDISSSHIRNRLFHREPVDYMVPEKVNEYIVEHGLYR
ncbi:nicotinate-nucleotide adenylyltransferase [Candidatus Desantisbacteria bacterium]|nr:nicotinate-nucleotide adenylyltransferase [Candidatus Desantisbacteria bacterium]